MEKQQYRLDADGETVTLVRPHERGGLFWWVESEHGVFLAHETDWTHMSVPVVEAESL